TTTVEQELGAIGAVSMAGFSPLGVDVYNFPQRRINNTYQLADEVTWSRGNHTFAFGADLRRTELDSDLPRNSRPFVTFNSSPRLILANGVLRLPTATDPNPIVRAEDLAAFGAANNFFLTLSTASTNDTTNLRFNQINFYGQDSWRVNSRLNIHVGLRYEYNSPVSEANQTIENTFNDPALALAPGLRTFIAGRTRIYDPDRNNFAPRFGIATTVKPFGPERLTILRGGYGIFYDQILGAVASQSRNVYPTFLTMNFGGLTASTTPVTLSITNPARTFVAAGPNQFIPIQLPNTLNSYNPAIPLNVLIGLLNNNFPSALGATIPQRHLEMPMSQHYTFTVEQIVNRSLVLSAAYVGTQGRHLLRFTTPNQGPSSTIAPVSFNSFQLNLVQGSFQVPEILGIVRAPNRSVAGIGAVYQFETSANSHYNALQLEARARTRRSLSFRAAYTLSSAVDDVSDVFDLAGAFALPQNSLSFAGERGPANFDVRHRFTYGLIYDVPYSASHSAIVSLFTRGVQLASTGSFATGQPFTVNSAIDVNLDGNTTDRLNSTQGLVETGNRQQPLVLTTNDPLSLLAPFGQDGSISRNSFRSGNVLELNLAAYKDISWSKNTLRLKVEIFNLVNRANFGVPIRILEFPAFGSATNTITPGRRVEFGLKYSF
ncbi:MAG TPA: TonB-dependent receptor, partial [Pyrinomonadaceae bacterium]